MTETGADTGKVLYFIQAVTKDISLNKVSVKALKYRISLLEMKRGNARGIVIEIVAKNWMH